MPSTINDKFAHLRIPLEDIVKATNNFHHDNIIIGHSGPGTVYRGRLLQSKMLREITARRFDWKHGEGHLEFFRELSILSDLSHPNLVSIIGFCDEKDEKIIVTMYETNGNLGQCLNNPNLTWLDRLWVSIGVAHALSYLHDVEGRDYCIIHCNINSDMIQLDRNGEAKLYGFEHSIKQAKDNKDQVTLCEHIGTMGCMDPEIEKTGGVTQKSDIYALGVILFEVLCGRRAFIDDHENEANRFLVSLAKIHYDNKSLQDIISVDLYDDMSPQSVVEYSNLAYSCLNEDRARRPDINDVVNELEQATQLQFRYKFIVNNFQHLKVPLHDIKSATRNFEDTYKFLDDSRGSWYRVDLHHFDKQNHSLVQWKNKCDTVVIKRRHSLNDHLHNEEHFFTEIEMLNRVKHPNIATLLAFCIEGFEMILITDNVSNGFLGSYLGEVNGMRIFTWEKRLKICIDVAHALNYLHYEMEDQKMIINRDIQSLDIGLDENWGARIMGFETSIFVPLNQEDEELYPGRVGRPSYIDPEYKLTNKLKRESDVYCFGVVLLEILCGRLANAPIYKKESDRGLVVVARQSFCSGTLEEMIDPTIKEEMNENNFVLKRGPNKDSLNTFIEIAIQCVADTQDQRPSMRVVVRELEKSLLFQISEGEEGASTSTEISM